MRLDELLEHTRTYLDDATELLDGDPDILWPDTLIVRYLNEAQRILTRRAWVIIETGVAPAGVITLVTGKALYPLHKSVLRVFDATPTTQTSALGRGTDAQLRNPNPTAGDAFDVGEAASRAGTTETGAAIAFATDAGSRMLRVYRTPTAAENGTQVVLKVARMPVCYLDVNELTKSPEVPEEWHLELCSYAAGRCLMQPNIDSQSKADGRELLAGFEKLVKEARQERQRAEMGTGRWAFASTTAVL